MSNLFHFEHSGAPIADVAPPAAQMAAMNIAGAGPADGERRGARERGSRHAVSFTRSSNLPSHLKILLYSIKSHYTLNWRVVPLTCINNLTSIIMYNFSGSNAAPGKC